MSSSRQRRGEAAIAAGLDPADWMFSHFGLLARRAARARGPERIEAEALARELGLALMPYVKPRLRSVQAKVEGATHVTIEIGGED